MSHRLHNLRMENDAVGFSMDEMRPRFERIANRKENGTVPRAVSAYQLFQTPPELAKRLASMAGKPLRVLEPSAGLGRILDAISCECVAVEQSPQLCAELYRQERTGVKILQRDFLSVQPSETGLFDAVVMNPPFHMRSDIAHITHALRFLKTGGTLVGICLNTTHREKALRHLCDHWEVLPDSTFAKEGTRVSTVLFRIRP